MIGDQIWAIIDHGKHSYPGPRFETKEARLIAISDDPLACVTFPANFYIPGVGYSVPLDKIVFVSKRLLFTSEAAASQKCGSFNEDPGYYDLFVREDLD